ncbi:hypothetical protein [Persephonella sp.]
MKVLELFKKKLKFDIRMYKSKLDEIDKDLVNLISIRNDLYDKYIDLKRKKFEDVNSLHFKAEYLKKLREEISDYDSKIKTLEMKKEAVKLQVKLKNAEKKSIEKYLENINKDFQKKELKKEIQIAETSYSNRR